MLFQQSALSDGKLGDGAEFLCNDFEPRDGCTTDRG